MSHAQSILLTALFLGAMSPALGGAPPGPQAPDVIADGLRRHDRALHVKTGWIRDPYIVLAPDGWYYLTGTTPNPGDPREAADPYNTGLGEGSMVGYHIRLWRSRDLVFRDTNEQE
jgi:hypothetical protein